MKIHLTSLTKSKVDHILNELLIARDNSPKKAFKAEIGMFHGLQSSRRLIAKCRAKLERYEF